MGQDAPRVDPRFYARQAEAMKPVIDIRPSVLAAQAVVGGLMWWVIVKAIAEAWPW